MKYTNRAGITLLSFLLCNSSSFGQQHEIEKEGATEVVFAVQRGAEKEEAIGLGGWMSEVAKKSIDDKLDQQSSISSNTFTKTHFGLYAPYENDDILALKKYKKGRKIVNFGEDPIKYIDDCLKSGNEALEMFVNEKATRLNLDSDYMVRGRITVRDLETFGFVPTLHFNLPETSFQIELKRKF